MIEAAPASAQSFWGYWNGPSESRAARNARNRRAAAKAASAASSKAEKAAQSKPQIQSEGPLTLVVSLRAQRVSVFDKNGQVTSAPISTGRPGFPTPTGIFSVIQKNRIHYSNLYHSAPMPFMQRITWSGVALHAGALPGYPASHGCIRLPYSFAPKLFAMTKMGTRVIVSRDPVEPQTFTHDLLLKPLPAGSQNDMVKAIGPEDGAAIGKVASNASDMPMIISAAAAEGTASEAGNAPRTRTSVAAERAAQMIRLSHDLDAAKAATIAAAEKLKSENALVDPARTALRIISNENARVMRAQQQAGRALAAAEDEIAYLTQRIEKGKLKSKALARAVSAKTKLEEKLPALRTAFEAAKQDASVPAEAIASKEAALAAAEASRDEARRAWSAAQQAQKLAETALGDAKRAEARRDQPVTVVVSRKTGRLRMRHGYDDVLDVAVSITDPASFIGTHVYTALAYDTSGNALDWNAVTVIDREQAAAPKKSGYRDRYERAVPPPSPATPARTAAGAIERIDIPADVRMQIAELLKPGSSLIITDEGIGNETGKYTDLIVQTR